MDSISDHAKHQSENNDDEEVVPLILSEQLNNQHISDSDTSSLIPGIGREISIQCLICCPRSSYGSIVMLNRSFHDLITSGKLYKQRSNKGVIEHWIYLSCDMMKWEAFDPISKKWMQLPLLQGNQVFKMGDKESLAVGTELLYLGRDILGQVIYKYSLLTNSWSLGQAMNTPRCLFGSASLGHIAIFAGGVDHSGKTTDVVEKYNGDSGTWEKLPNLLKPRRMSSGVFMDGKFYVIGGTGPDNRPWTCGEEFDLSSNKWTEVPNIVPVHRISKTSAPPLLAVVDNELYAADCVEMELKKYGKNNKEWETIGRLPERANNIDGWGIAFKGCGKQLIVVGGPTAYGPGYVDIHSWVPSQGPLKWTIIGNKKSYNFIYNCAIMGC